MIKRILPLIIFFVMVAASVVARNPHKASLFGKVLDENNKPLEFVTMFVKELNVHAISDEQGRYHLHLPPGTHIIRVYMLSYQEEVKQVEIKHGERISVDFKLMPEASELEEVIVVAKGGATRVNESAFNAVAIDATTLHNSSQDLATALNKISGVKLRESGGVGSDMQLSLDGFTGKHIKLFIDGVPQEGVGSSFSLNNIPINFAERIEVYKGVVPVGFGSDAIGGVVNIVTNKKQGFFVDASLTYGSFNTWKSSVNAGQTFANGLTYEINAFQNYSDNNYKIQTAVKDLSNGQIDKDKIETVRRFNDTYHNEAIIGKIGVVRKSWADRLLFTMRFTNSDKEIQNGVRQEIVFGEKRRKSYSLMPSVEYLKRNLFTDGLDLNLTVGYNYNVSHNLDTATRSFNWRGESIYNGGSIGEQSYQNNRYASNNWNGTLNLTYRLGEMHEFMLNHVLSSFDRKTLSSVNAADNAAVASSFPKYSMKNISGLSYRFTYHNYFNLSVFGKYYNQHSSGPRNASTTGGFSYEMFSENVGAFGYGAAGTVFITKGLQAKLSYEKAYRLPTIDELFGDEDLELGAIGLKPENSHNANVSLSYNLDIKKNGFYIEGGFIYRNTKDYIRRTINSYSGGLYYGLYENHGRVQTTGFNAEVRYNYSHWIQVGGNMSYLNIVDKEKYVAGNTLQESTSYGVRLPNTPYLFANADVSFGVKDCFAKGNFLTITYNLQYVHEFPLYWETHGNQRNKQRVPTQLSHDLSLLYSIQEGRYNISLECINLADAALYDNFSLQKAGRAFYGKFRFYFNR